MKHISMGKIRDFKTLKINIAKSCGGFIRLDEKDGIKIPVFGDLPTLRFFGTVKLHGTNSSVV